MRHVFENSMVAHVWAQQVQGSGRSGNGQFYFDGPVLYSYGSHFVVARFAVTSEGQPLLNENGARVVLLNSDTYSITTTRHQRHARNALRGLPVEVLGVSGLKSRTLPDLETYAKLVSDKVAEASRKRKQEARDYALEQAEGLVHSAERLSTLFNLNWPSLREAGFEAVLAGLAERQRVAAEERQRQVEAQRVLDNDKRAAWLRGEDVVFPYSYADAMTYCRVIGNTVETSRGAVVPLDAARKVLRMAAKVRASGQRWAPQGLQGLTVGQFTLRWIDADGTTVIGCHTLEYPEMVRAACTGDPDLAADLGFDCAGVLRAECCA